MNTPRRQGRIFRVAGLALLASLAGLARAAPLPVAHRAELVGMGATVPESTRRFLAGMVAFCGQYGAAPQTAMADAFAAWQKRQQRYLDASLRVKADLYAALRDPGSPPGGTAQVDQMYNVDIPKMVAAKIAKNSKSISDLPAQARAGGCLHFAQTIAGGTYDVDKNHPDVAAYLARRLQDP